MGNKGIDIYPVVFGITKLFKSKKYTTVDNILATAPINSLSVLQMVGLIRTTYCAKTKLSQWKITLDNIRRELVFRGENASALLRGLNNV